jgi:glutaredoxin
MKQDEKSPPDPQPRQPLPTKPLEVTLYTRPGCHLCNEAKSQMAPLLAEFGARLREVNIDADPELRELYNLDVPVIFLADRKIAKHRVDPAQFRRQLAEARQRSAQRD